MGTSKTWPGGSTGATPSSYTIPAAGELNWAALSDFLAALADGAQATTFQKFAVRKATTSPVTVSATTDCVVLTDLGTPGAVTVNLPAGASKQVFIVSDGKGDAGTNNITINRAGSDTIGGSTSLVLNQNREGVILIYNSSDTDWKILGRLAGSSYLVNPMTTSQDIIVGGASGTPGRLAKGSNNTVLVTNGSGNVAYTSITNSHVDAAAAIDGSKLVAASGSVSGVVTTGTQTLAGAKTFSGAVDFTAGITFSAGSSLDTYTTTGSWTPTLTATTTPFNLTYSVQSGSYIQIGKEVFFTLAVAYANTTTNSAAGSMRISLPSTASVQSVANVMAVRITWSADRSYLVGYIASSTNYVDLMQCGNGVLNDSGALAALNNSTGVTRTIVISGLYRVA
jgi:hypothetical protein